MNIKSLNINTGVNSHYSSPCCSQYMPLLWSYFYIQSPGFVFYLLGQQLSKFRLGTCDSKTTASIWSEPRRVYSLNMLLIWCRLLVCTNWLMALTCWLRRSPPPASRVPVTCLRGFSDLTYNPQMFLRHVIFSTRVSPHVALQRGKGEINTPWQLLQISEVEEEPATSFILNIDPLMKCLHAFNAAAAAAALALAFTSCTM